MVNISVALVSFSKCRHGFVDGSYLAFGILFQEIHSWTDVSETNVLESLLGEGLTVSSIVSSLQLSGFFRAVLGVLPCLGLQSQLCPRLSPSLRA